MRIKYCIKYGNKIAIFKVDAAKYYKYLVKSKQNTIISL